MNIIDGVFINIYSLISCTTEIILKIHKSKGD